MRAFKKEEGLAVPYDKANVDTDEIIPASWLKRVERTGFGAGLFYAKRFNADGTPNPEFILNQPRYKGARILIAGPNFGCGSSREHAPWALEDYGFRAIVAPSFADIFYNNCTKIGLLPVVLPEEEVKAVMEAGEATVDLERQVVAFDGREVEFHIDEDARYRLLNGLDEIGITLQSADEI